MHFRMNIMEEEITGSMGIKYMMGDGPQLII